MRGWAFGVALLSMSCAVEPPPPERLQQTASPLWTASASLGAPRAFASLVALPGSKAMLFGSADAATRSTAEWFDGTTWSSLPSAPIAASSPGGAALADGRVLFVGSEASAFDPVLKTWSPKVSTGISVAPFAFTVSGGALIGGGGGVRSARFASSTSSLVDLGTMPNVWYGWTQLDDGRVAAPSYYLNALWDGAAWSTFPADCGAYSAQHYYAAAALDSKRLLVSGGQLGSGLVIRGAAILDVDAKTCTPAADLPSPRTGHSALRLPSGRVLVVGGADQGGNPIADADVFDPATGKWSSAGKLATARRNAAIAVLTDGRVMIAGGLGAAGALSSVELYRPLADGLACATPGECASGLCVDGVCCKTACADGCSSCKLAGKEGTCSPITGAAKVEGACAPFASCKAGACVTSCGSDADCASTHFCVAGACTPKRDYGTACKASAECASGFCVDGFCCTSACTAQCGACDVPGKEGVCWPAKGKPHGARTTCGAATSPECGSQCDGVDPTKCSVPSTATPCGAATCKDGVERHVGLCDGAGACSDAPKGCGAYACASALCKTTCATHADCAPGFACRSGACAPADGVGKPCTADSCGAGLFCTDGICCGEASCAAGSACVPLAGGGAACRKRQGGSCSADAECGSGHCVDGVCCDTACTDTCVACDLPSALGVCSLVKGAPHGARPACAKGADVCGDAACNGVEPKTCAAFAGTDIPCRPASCKDGVAEEAARCDGKGACAAAAKTACGAYACDDRTATCRKACSADGDCAAGSTCAAGVCERKSGVCSADASELLASDGTKTSCTPFLCVDGRCTFDCETTAGCAGGYLCDPSTRKCVAFSTPTDQDSGGCSTSHRRSGGGGAYALLLLAGAIVLRRRAAALALAGMFGCSADRPAPTPTQATRAGLWAETKGTLSAGRGSTVGAKLPSGKVLIVGSNFDTTDLFDPITETWTAGPSLPYWTGDAELVPVGARFMLVGGYDFLSPKTSFYDPATNTWSAGPDQPEGGVEYRSVALPNGQVLVHHGFTSYAPVVYEPSTNSWSSAPIATAASGPALALLPGNQVLRAGGYTGSALTTLAYVYSSASKTWSKTTDLPAARAYATSVPLSDGRVLVTGGTVTLAGTVTVTSGTSLVFDATTSAWSPRAPMLTPRSDHAMLRLPNGRVLVTGGGVGSGVSSDPPAATASTEIYDPARDRWFSAGAMTFPRRHHAMVLLDDGRVLVAGGGPTVATDVLSFRALGQSCAVAGECDSLACVDGVCCEAESCGGGGRCNLPGKVGKCAKLPGGACASAAECGSGFCVDGVCCESACSGLCEACDAPAALGKCSVVAGPTRGTRPPCPSGADVCTATRCDGVDRTACHLPPKGTVACGAPSCAAGVETHASTCDGAGKCGDTPTGCGLLLCGASSCLTTCAAASDCVEGYSCRSGACVPKTGLGTACAANADCKDGLFCTDGVCCGSASCGKGSRCDAPGKAGRCARVDATACAVDDECASGHCVDGLCCESACAGQCEACNLAGLEGKCAPVLGKPVGARPVCTGEGCSAHLCDGKERASCAAFVGTDIVCRAATCSGATAVREARCDGAGGCPAEQTVDCKGFTCDDAGACRTSCTSASDCRVGFGCTGGTCQALTAVCSDDGISVVKPDGARERCYPLRCEAGACLAACNATSQCAGGFVCDTAAGTCVAPTAAPADGGGCAYGRSPAHAWIGLAALAALATRRRRFKTAAIRARD